MIRFRPLALLCLIAAPCAATAQDLGTSRVEADVRVAGFYTDNFYYNSPATGAETVARGALINPRVAFDSSLGRVDLNLGLDGEIGTFDTPGARDDYVDGRFLAGLAAFATSRGRLDVHASLQRAHDPFGTSRTENASARDIDLDRWNQAAGGALFHYGAAEATFNAELGLDLLGRSYTTNRAETAFLDYRSVAGQTTLFYNYSPKTAALFEVGRTSYKFDQAFGPVDDRSGDETRLRVGGRWLATGKTSGEIRVGYYRRTFDNTSFSDSGLDWAAGIRWAPRARSKLSLDTGRSEQQSFRAGTFVNLTRSASVSWSEDWTSRTNTSVRVGDVHIEYLGAGRGDHLYNASLGLNHTLSRYVALVFGLDIANRTSNDPTSEFKRFSSYLGVRFSR